MSWKCLLPGRANSANWRERTLALVRCSASSCHFAPGAPMGKPERSECAQKTITEHRTIEWSTYSFRKKRSISRCPHCDDVPPEFSDMEIKGFDSVPHLT